MEGEMEASNAPRMNRKTMSPGNEVNAARIMQDADHPTKQKIIQWLTLNLTSAYTDTAVSVGYT